MSDAPTPSPDGEAPSGGSKAKLPLIAAIVVGLAVGAGSGAAIVGPVVAKKLGFSVSAPKAAAHSAAGADSETVDPAAEGGDAHGAAAEEGGKAGEAAAPPVLLLENLVLNPANSGGSRYLLMSIAIEGTNAKAVAAMTARDAEVRDLILSTLGRKTVDELSDVTARDAIKAELIAAVQERFGKTSVKQLYFPQFVIQ